MAASLLKRRYIWVHLLQVEDKKKSVCFDISRLEIKFYISFPISPVFSLQDCMAAKEVLSPAAPSFPQSPWGAMAVDCAGSLSLMGPGAVAVQNQPFLCTPICGPQGCRTRLEHLHSLGRSPS